MSRVPNRTSMSRHLEIKSEKEMTVQSSFANVEKQPKTSNEIDPMHLYLKRFIQTGNKLGARKRETIAQDIKDEEAEEKEKEEARKKSVRQVSICQVQAVSLTRMGIRNYDNMQNQDVLLEDEIVNTCKIYGVFDGHGQHGRSIALTAKNTFQTLLKKYSEEIKNENGMFSIETIVKKVLQKTNLYLLHYKAEEAQFSGTTVLVVIVTAKQLHVFNVGNSRAVLGKYYEDIREIKPFQVTHDHTLSRFDERLRVINSGAAIERFKNQKGELMGPERIWVKNEKYPGITVTRTLGLSCAYKLGVLSEPQVSIYDNRDTFKFLVLASDGLWTVFDNKEVIETLEKGRHISMANHANSLIFQALKRWRSKEELTDDISLIVVPLIQE